MNVQLLGYMIKIFYQKKKEALPTQNVVQDLYLCI